MIKYINRIQYSYIKVMIIMYFVFSFLFANTYAFLYSKSIISKYNSRYFPKVKYLKMGNTDLPPSFQIQQFYGKSVGEIWSYGDLFEKANDKLVESVSITDDSKTAIAIDTLHKVNDIQSTNLHVIKILPSQTEHLMKFLLDNKINVDLLTLPKNDFIEILNKMGEAFFNIGIYFFVFGLITNIIRGIGNGQMDNMTPPFLKGVTNTEVNIIDSNNVNTTFANVAGCDEAKFELIEVVDFLKNSEKYEIAGAKIPKGVLLEGSPGTGKTLLARAVAGEAGVPFISASGSEFIEMFVGVGASRVRNLFQKARENAPCVIFIDEIDAVGRQRGAGIAGGNDEREQTLNQILTNMDGFTENEGIVVLAATNRIDILDNALTRPGRFDRKIKVPLPDLMGRRAILDVHFSNKNVDNSVDFDEIATLTTGFSGADIANLANEAAIFTVRRNESAINRNLLLDAYEKCTIGLTSNIQVMDPDIVELVSNHETGHALLASLFDDMYDVRKVTINENKNGMGGYTLFTPKERFQKYATKKFLLANLIIALGGRAAEVYLYRQTSKSNVFDNYVFDKFKDLDITTGASNDLLQANKIARSYITEYGFGDSFGQFDDNMNNDLPFMGREMASSSRTISERMKFNVDEQVSQLVHFAFHKALELIELNEVAFNEVVMLLKEKRIINGKEIRQIINKNNE